MAREQEVWITRKPVTLVLHFSESSYIKSPGNCDTVQVESIKTLGLFLDLLSTKADLKRHSFQGTNRNKQTAQTEFKFKDVDGINICSEDLSLCTAPFQEEVGLLNQHS